MVYYRKRYTSRSSYRKRSYGYSYRKNSRVATKGYVKSLISRNEETKYLDVTINLTASSVAYGYNEIAGLITQGTSRTNRVGNKITVLGMKYQLRVLNGDSYNLTRMLILDRMPGSIINTASAISALEGPVNTDVFRPLVDRLDWNRMLPTDGSTSAQVGQSKIHRGYIRYRKVLDYGGGTYPILHNLGIQFHSDSLVLPNPGLTGYIRIYFKDA